MSYGMHHYLMEKAAQQEGMRKEAGAVQTIGKILSLPFRSKKGFTDTVRGIGIDSAESVRKAHFAPSGSYTANLPRGFGEKMAEKMLTHRGLTRAGIATAEGAVGAGIIGGGAYGINKALEKDSYLDKALELLNQYKGTAAGVSAGIPTAIAAAAMSKPGSRLKNALLYGALASIIGGGAGYAYDRYNA